MIMLAGRSIIIPLTFLLFPFSSLFRCIKYERGQEGGKMSHWTGTRTAITSRLSALLQVTPTSPRETQPHDFYKTALHWLLQKGGCHMSPGQPPSEGVSHSPGSEAVGSLKAKGILKAKGSRQSKTGLCASLRTWFLFLTYSLNGGWIWRRSNPQQTIVCFTALKFWLRNTS